MAGYSGSRLISPEIAHIGTFPSIFMHAGSGCPEETCNGCHFVAINFLVQELTEWGSLNYILHHWIIADAGTGPDRHIRDEGPQTARR